MNEKPGLEPGFFLLDERQAAGLVTVPERPFVDLSGYS